MRRLLTVAASLLLGTGCLIPTDRTDDLRLEILTSVPVLFIGDTLRVSVRLVDVQGRVAPSPVFDFSAADSAVVAFGDGGLVRAVGEGATEVTVRAAQFGDVPPAQFTVRVQREIGIFSVSTATRPDADTVQYGEVVTIVGTGLDPEGLSLLSFGGVAAPVQEFIAADPDDLGSFDTLRVWVPPPAPSASDLIVVRQIGGSALRPLTVLELDVFEPNDQAPFDLGDIITRFTNPALAMEAPAEAFLDWYRMRAPPGSDGMTIVVSVPGGSGGLVDAPVTFEISGRRGAEFFEPPDWMISPRGFGICDGVFHTFLSFLQQDSALFAFEEIPGFGPEEGVVDIGALKAGLSFQAVPYRIDVRPGYHANLGPDAFEENDFCTAAPPLPVGAGVVTANFDHSLDLDWFRVDVPGPVVPPPAATMATIFESEPNDTPAAADTVAVGDRVIGTITPNGDRDVFVFDVEEGVTLTLDIDASDVGSRLDPVLELLDSTGTVIAQNDDFGSLDSRIDFRISVAGRYYTRVTDFGGTGSADHDYTLKIDARIPTHRLTVRLNSQVAGIQPHMTLFDLAGDEILPVVAEGVCCSGPDAQTVLDAFVASGSHALLIGSIFGEIGTYTFNATLTPIPTVPPDARLQRVDGNKDRLRPAYRQRQLQMQRQLQLQPLHR